MNSILALQTNALPARSKSITRRRGTTLQAWTTFQIDLESRRRCLQDLAGDAAAAAAPTCRAALVAVIAVVAVAVAVAPGMKDGCRHPDAPPVDRVIRMHRDHRLQPGQPLVQRHLHQMQIHPSPIATAPVVAAAVARCAAAAAAAAAAVEVGRTAAAVAGSVDASAGIAAETYLARANPAASRLQSRQKAAAGADADA